jgi:hypothetical protein
MTLPLLWPSLQVGAVVLLDDAKRPRLEARCLAAWQAAFGGAIRIARYTELTKGLALIQEVAPEPGGRSSTAWWASAMEALWTAQWRVRHRLGHQGAASLHA